MKQYTNNINPQTDFSQHAFEYMHTSDFKNTVLKLEPDTTNRNDTN